MAESGNVPARGREQCWTPTGSPLLSEDVHSVQATYMPITFVLNPEIYTLFSLSCAQGANERYCQTNHIKFRTRSALAPM